MHYDSYSVCIHGYNCLRDKLTGRAIERNVILSHWDKEMVKRAYCENYYIQEENQKKDSSEKYDIEEESWEKGSSSSDSSEMSTSEMNMTSKETSSQFEDEEKIEDMGKLSSLCEKFDLDTSKESRDKLLVTLCRLFVQILSTK